MERCCIQCSKSNVKFRKYRAKCYKCELNSIKLKRQSKEYKEKVKQYKLKNKIHIQKRDKIYRNKPEVKSKFAKFKKTKEYQKYQKEYQKQWYKTISGKAQRLLSSLKRRCKKKKLKHNIDVSWIKQKLQAGRCEYTKLQFSKETLLRASIDRIDSSKGYLKSNCRMVCWGYNVLKSNMTDKDAYLICKAVVREHSSHYGKI